MKSASPAAPGGPTVRRFDGSTPRVYAKAKTKTEAKQVERSLLAQRENGGLPTNRTTLATWLDYWLTKELPTRKPAQRTIETYQIAIENHIKPHIGDLPLSKLNVQRLKHLERTLLERLSPGTVGQTHAILRAALETAVEDGLLPHNPMSFRAPRREPKEVIPPDGEDVGHLLTLAREVAPEWFPAYYLITVSGMRRGEALGLIWEWVDLLHGQIAVNGQLQRTRAKGLVDGPTKSKSSHRIIDLDATTVQILSDHRQAQDRRVAELGPAYNYGAGRVFDNGFGGPLSPESFYRTLKALGARVGIQEITVHKLRHFNASLSLASGETLADIAARLGHSSPMITGRVYVHSLPSRHRGVAERIGALVAEKVNVGKMLAAVPNEVILGTKTLGMRRTSYGNWGGGQLDDATVYLFIQHDVSQGTHATTTVLFGDKGRVNADLFGNSG